MPPGIVSQDQFREYKEAAAGQFAHVERRFDTLENKLDTILDRMPAGGCPPPGSSTTTTTTKTDPTSAMELILFRTLAGIAVFILGWIASVWKVAK